VPDPDKAKDYVAKIKADAAAEQKRRREAEAKKGHPPTELLQRLANPEKPKCNWLKVAGGTDAGDKPKVDKPEMELGPKDSAQLGVAVANAMAWLARDGAKIYTEVTFFD